MILCLSGLKGSGKDVIGSLFVTRHGFKRLSFADALKELCSTIFNIPVSHFNDVDKKDALFKSPILLTKEHIDTLNLHLISFGYPAVDFYSFIDTPIFNNRHILTFIGTDLCRKHVDDKIWVKRLINTVNSANSNLVITDARFDNERSLLKEMGAITMLVDRPAATLNFDANTAHISELEQLAYNYDVIVKNDSTISVLESDLNMWYTRRRNCL